MNKLFYEHFFQVLIDTGNVLSLGEKASAKWPVEDDNFLVEIRGKNETTLSQLCKLNGWLQENQALPLVNSVHVVKISDIFFPIFTQLVVVLVGL